MSTYSEVADRACDAYLDTLRRSQDATIQAVASFADQLGRTVPSFLASVQGSALHPDAAGAFVRFAARLVQNQREFAYRLLEATQITEGGIARVVPAERPEDAGAS